MRLKTVFLIRHSTAIGIAAVSVLMLLVALMFYRQAQVVYHAQDMVVHSYEVTGHIQSFFGNLKDAEIGQRGYIITGQDNYLDPYRDAINGIPAAGASPPQLSIAQELAVLRQETADNPVQQRHLDELTGISSGLLAHMADTIRLRKEQGMAAVTAQPDPHRGKQLMDRIRAIVGEMLAEENRLLSHRTRMDDVGTRRNELLTFSAITLFYAGMVFSVWLAMRHAARARGMESAILEQARELAESRAFLKNILNHIPDPIFVKDTQHRWIEGNSALWSLMGKPETEMLYKSDYDFFPKAEADVFWRKDDEVFKSGQANINIENFTDASGMTHIISTKKATFQGPEDQLVLVGVIRDITELTRMQEKLRESDEARLKSIMEHLDRPVYIKDLEGRYVQVNKDFLALLQRGEKEVIGKTDYELFSQEYADSYRKNDEAVIAGAAAVEYEEKAMQGDGVHTYMSVKFPLYDAADRIYALCGISTDITERKQAEAQRLRYMQELKRSNQELDDFAYIASHDLKEPLRGLFNHASFLLEDYKDKLDADGVHRLGRLSLLCQRMEHLVNDLLYYSRLGRTELAVQDTDPNAIVGDIRQLLESFLREHHAQVIVPAPMPHIVCDRPRITEVFRNLITNAVKYNDKAEPLVEVGFLDTVDAPHGVEKNVFYVKDNGIGIEREFHEEIFRIFKRLQRPDDGKETGTGVGLTFVKKIVERHNGRVWLASEPGSGSIFYFTIGRRDA